MVILPQRLALCLFLTSRLPSIVGFSPFQPHKAFITRRSLAIGAQPKRGSIVDTYQTVSVQCTGCGQRLFRYKKKNGTKSGLVKCFVERIAEDSAGVLAEQGSAADAYHCPSCETRFARSAVIRGLPALKLVGGKTRMTKK